MKAIFDQVSLKTSKIITRTYSTSFSLGIKFLNKKYRNPVYSIYGFVRLGDEIVDSFHDFDKQKLFNRFKEDVYMAIDNQISLNPVLNNFQKTVHDFNIDKKLIGLFLKSMEMDLNKREYNEKEYKEYILGSAEVVGLMCLMVFCKGDKKKYEELKNYAMKLGSAYQKINFLRDLKADYHHLGRTYFPGIEMEEFNDSIKARLENEIENDFKEGFKGIRKLPKPVKFGVYLSYVYFYGLLKKIKNISSKEIVRNRVRISNKRKYYILGKSILKYKLNLI